MANGGTVKNPDPRFQQVAKIIIDNEQFLIVADGQRYDAVAAASALTLLLTSLQKKVVLYSPTPLKTKEFNSLQGLDQFQTELAPERNKILIDLNYPVDQVERVSSREEGNKLTLVVEFQSGATAINPDQIKIRPAKPEFQAGFILDCLPDSITEIVNQGSWVWLSTSDQTQPWAQVAFNNKKASLSELTTTMIAHAGFQWPVSAAENLYQGIKQATDNFEKVDSIALETAAYCLKIKEGGQSTGISAGPVKPTGEGETPIEAVEKKEGQAPEGGMAAGGWQKPPIFTGATTPKG